MMYTYALKTLVFAGKQEVIEIIPNWHPIFVHFTFALFTTSVGFYGLAYLTSRLKITSRSFTNEFEIVSRWCLWGGALISILTVLAGLNAFNTVNHDAISHVAMHEHRSWALPTAAAILLIACWSLWRYMKQKNEPVLIFLIILFLIQLSLMSTAWHGSELVYRYGLGVMSLPTHEESGHHHHHGEEIQSSNPTPSHSQEHNHDSHE